LKEKNRGGLTPKGYQVVPILGYHTFSENCKTPLCTPRKTFDRQMKYLKDNQYRVISLKQLRGFLRYQRRLPEKSIVITFDDGYRAVYDIAYPVLKKYGFKGTLFIYTDFVEKSKNAITWGELKELKAAGFEIGSHGVSHDDLTKKKKGENDKAYLARVKRELRLSKKIIDKRLRQNTIYLAFPFGNYNQRILYLSEQSGYKMGLSVKGGGNPFFADPLALRRYQIRNMDMKSFVTRLGTFKKYSLE
jgi:peptidoglycan/xylan/chitin deacetylase (PgdA/CDA1 family)